MTSLCDSIGSVNLSTPRRSSRRLTPMKVDENEVCRTPRRSVRVDLNESFRRSVLRTRCNTENTRCTIDDDEEVEALKQDVTPRKRFVECFSVTFLFMVY